MKAAICLLAALALGAAVTAAGAATLVNTVQPKVTQLKNGAPKTGLYVGNSFTYYNCGVNGYVRGFTKEEKRDWIARMITISGGRLSYHSVKEYLAPHPFDGYDKHKPKFDVVFLQAQSTEPINPKEQANFNEWFARHVATIREAGSEPIAIITWALKDKPEQYQKLADATITQANKLGVYTIPVGPAFAESLKTRPDLILHMPDKRHPTAAGSYLYGSVIYSALFHKSPEGFKFLGACEKPLKAEDAKYLQQVAWKVTKEFYGWK
ncbi:SGNH/GDSL hydrolase family protein [Mesosutterella sp. OilRF-GAM-744-9]|uniref:SGNH/GDSL hydrolase family protein n=1 Tax=Mesosutterella porci TaxID=2915351 RepID=A0ABS9MNF0_9BURK|nr:SGNH/GDSL hydrolase family protein [Mesosutterella sp. oilRF-744-WT-GAM-9]MCG5029854.1 SGNH/GDSL hydrolase family protein [Mesosutterella sp. oilRF-744-WT-GAM-9]